MHVILPGPRNEWPATKVVLVTPAADVEAAGYASPWHRAQFPNQNIPAAWFGDDCLPRTFAVTFSSGSAYVQHLLYLKMLELGLARAGGGPDPQVDDRTEMDHGKRDRFSPWVRPATAEEIAAQAG